jgi:hypothetical protein
MIQLEKLLNWYSTLTPERVRLAVDFYHARSWFKDPFNEVQGVDAIIKVFDHMFITTESPQFIMAEQIVQNNQAFVTWTFNFQLKGKSYSVAGSSHLKFDEHGLILVHRDYWDAAEELFQKLPLVGAPVRWLRQQFAIPL